MPLRSNSWGIRIDLCVSNFSKFFPRNINFAKDGAPDSMICGTTSTISSAPKSNHKIWHHLVKSKSRLNILLPQTKLLTYNLHPMIGGNIWRQRWQLSSTGRCNYTRKFWVFHSKFNISVTVRRTQLLYNFILHLWKCIYAQ